MSSPIVVNGLPLPGELVALLEAGRWPRRPDPVSAHDLLPGDLFPEGGELMLHPVPLVEFESRGLYELEQIDRPMFMGEADPADPPGDIDPALTVLIGDLGIGFDQPIALDYRPSRDRPRVLTLRWGPWAKNNRWVQIAPDFKVMAEVLRL